MVGHVGGVWPRPVEWTVAVAQGQVQDAAVADAAAVHQWAKGIVEVLAHSFATPVAVQEDFDIVSVLDHVQLIVDFERAPMPARSGSSGRVTETW